MHVGNCGEAGLVTAPNHTYNLHAFVFKHGKDMPTAEIGWYDLAEGVRVQILRHSHPPQTVALEWTEPSVWAGRLLAKVPMTVRMELKRERKRLTGIDLLEITITRKAVLNYEAYAYVHDVIRPEPDSPGQTYTGTWHNVSRIRYIVSRTSHNTTFEFIGKDADGRETTFYPPDWVIFDDIFHRFHCECVFEELGLTRHQTQWTLDAEVREYSTL